MTKSQPSFLLVSLTAMLLGTATVAPAVPLLNLANGNYYDVIEGSFTFNGAIADAATHTFFGLPGHVVTVTSQAEQDFLSSTLSPLTDIFAHWLGASDAAVEGEWRWVTGPEAGTLFWKDGVTLSYAAWGLGEPNNFGDEDFPIFRIDRVSWNDIPEANLGYVIEWETGQQAVPEPTTLGLFGLGALVALGRRRRS